MRDYGKIHVSFWTSKTLSTLDSDARLLAAYLLTSPHTNMAGCFRVPEAYACDDLNWPSERLRNGFKTLSDCGFLCRDNESAWVWLCSFAKWNKPDNPNQKKAIEKLLKSVPDSVFFKSDALSSFGFSETVLKPLGNTPVPDPVPVPTQEQDETVEKIPLDDGSNFEVTQSFVAEMSKAYPRIDIAGELGRMRAWTIANTANRKTRRGIQKFINGWLSRAQPPLASAIAVRKPRRELGA